MQGQTHHKAQAGSAQAGPPGARQGPELMVGLGGQAALQGAGHEGTEQDGTGLGGTVRSRAPRGHKDQDQQTQPRALGGEVGTRVAQELQLNLGSLSTPALCLPLGAYQGHLLCLLPAPDGPAWASRRKSKPLWSCETMQMCLIQAGSPAWRPRRPGFRQDSLASQGSSQALTPITQKPWALTLSMKANDCLSPRVSAQGTHLQPEPFNTLHLVSCP